MAEEIEQNEYVHRVEWPMLAWALVSFIVTEELIRNFAAPGSLKTYICCSLGFTFANYTSKKSKGIARDALEAVKISSAVCLAFSVIAPPLKNFMPVSIAYGLPIFLMIMAYYGFVRIRGQQTNIYNYLKAGLIMAVLAGAMYALLP